MNVDVLVWCRIRRPHVLCPVDMSMNTMRVDKSINTYTDQPENIGAALSWLVSLDPFD
jgi:hypothetical protein